MTPRALWSRLSPKARTGVVVALLLLVALVWEAIALSSKETVAWSFSRFVWDISSNPLVVFLIGGVAGHFFFPKRRCLHCGFVPYLRTSESEQAFDGSLIAFAYAVPEASQGLFFALIRQADVQSVAALARGKRTSGFPIFQPPPKVEQGSARRVLCVALVLVAGLAVMGCGAWTKIPPCILDGSCLPTPRPPSPTPSATPTPAPSATPTPPNPPLDPSPFPSAPPSPSPLPTTRPTPRPTPSPEACGQTPPIDPVPVVHEGKCPDGYDGSWGDKGEHLCTIRSSCTSKVCPAQWDASAWCGNLQYALAGGLTSAERPYSIVAGYISNGRNGLIDAWGRRYRPDVVPPTRDSYLSDWIYMGNCDPEVVRPCPSPTPVPNPSPTPRPSVSPTPPVDPSEPCPRPDGIKLGFRASVKKDRGARNTFDVSPTVNGETVRPETGCGPVYLERYGIIQGFQSSSHFVFDGLEWQPQDPYPDRGYILVVATNSAPDEEWSGDKYLLAGPYTFCVSYPWLTTWRCQNGTMSTAGQLVGFGSNERAYDLAKR